MSKDKKTVADKVLGALARRMFPPDDQGKKADAELRDMTDGKPKDGGR